MKKKHTKKRHMQPMELHWKRMMIMRTAGMTSHRNGDMTLAIMTSMQKQHITMTNLWTKHCSMWNNMTWRLQHTLKEENERLTCCTGFLAGGSSSG